LRDGVAEAPNVHRSDFFDYDWQQLRAHRVAAT
jgi:hypothetical protein